MMNLEEIAKRISTPNMCSSSDIEPLRQLTEKYPFAQSFSILYLKALSLNNDIRFDEELQKHAYKITDRIRLYELINEKEKISQFENEVKIEKDVEVEINNEIEAESKIEIKNIKVGENEVLEEIFETNVFNEFQEKEEKSISEIIIDEIIEPFENTLESEPDRTPAFIPIKVDIVLPESQSEEFKSVSYRTEKKIETPSEIKEEIEEIINSVPETNFITDDLTEIISISNTLEDTTLEIDILAHAVSNTFTIDIDNEVKIEDQIESEVESEIEIENENEIEIENKVEVEKIKKSTVETKNSSKKSFYTWLKANNSQQISFENNFDSDDTFVEVKVDKLIEKLAEIKKNEENLEEIFSEKNPENNVELKNKIENIVEQFIKEEPSISRPQKTDNQEEKPKTEFYSPLKKAKSSLDETSLPVSETLAKIFAAQGNFPKAIYAYQQLMLIYPEKKIFFANQIEELTNKLNT